MIVFHKVDLSYHNKNENQTTMPPVYTKWIALFFALALISSFSGPKPPKITKQQLGEKLFFDPILSGDSTVSCGSCHIPKFYFADTLAFSRGTGGKFTKRNTPSVLNMANRDLLFWDGRAKSLAHQALFPIQDHDEMNMPIDMALKRLSRSKRYLRWFAQVYGQKPSDQNMADAIAAYEETLETSNSKFDLYMKDKAQFTSDEKAGQKIFVGKGQCFDCHFSPDFTGDEFKNIGLYNGKDFADVGRFAITKDSADLGKFKVPGLRNVAKTAPYMHNGMFKTLREVIDFYANPSEFVKGAIGTDPTVAKGLNLTEKEKQQLEAFLHTLTDETVVARLSPKKSR